MTQLLLYRSSQNSEVWILPQKIDVNTVEVGLLDWLVLFYESPLVDRLESRDVVTRGTLLSRLMCWPTADCWPAIKAKENEGCQLFRGPGVFYQYFFNYRLLTTPLLLSLQLFMISCICFYTTNPKIIKCKFIFNFINVLINTSPNKLQVYLKKKCKVFWYVCRICAYTD